MRTEVATTRLRVTPGVPTMLDIAVTNTSDVIDGITAIVTGLDPDWVQLTVPVVSLFPESSESLTFRILVPKTCLAGEYPVTIEVVSLVDPGRRSVHECWVSVDPIQAASMELRPSLVIGGKRAEFDVVLTNEGNIATDLIVSALEETRALSCIAEPSAVTVPANETRAVVLHASGPRPWFGQSVTRTISVEAHNDEIHLDALATFTQKPRIPRGVLTFLILAGIIALWATIFLVVVDLLRASAPTEKQAGLLLVEGPAAASNGTGAAGGNGADVDLSVIGASLTGTVTAENTGEPLPRITVEAQRIRRGGVLLTVGSAATDDEGVYTFDALLPGTYKLRFTADGFEERWYPEASDRGGAAEVSLVPGAEVADHNVQLVGLDGTFRGEIIAPTETGVSPLVTVSIVEVVENPDEATATRDPIAPFQTDRAFEIGGLTTPATYRFTVSSEGFEPRTFDEKLGAGQTKVINTVTLGAAPGSLAGEVRNASGELLGNVAVTLRSGETVKETTTPTSGQTGQYRFDELATPGTYILTFELEGYTSQTLSLSLGAGSNRVENVTLAGGAGQLSGRAVDMAGNPLGGVAITVREGEFTATTATLSDDSGTAAGTFAIRDLPTPGAYTVTFTLEGYESETVLVLLGDGQSQTGIDATMRRSMGSIEGTVTVAGQPRGDITVQLSDGGDPRTTVTATAPAGRFEFGDVRPGSYTLTFVRPNLPPRVVMVSVAAGQATIRNVDLPAGG